MVVARTIHHKLPRGQPAHPVAEFSGVERNELAKRLCPHGRNDTRDHAQSHDPPIAAGLPAQPHVGQPR